MKKWLILIIFMCQGLFCCAQEIDNSFYEKGAINLKRTFFGYDFFYETNTRNVQSVGLLYPDYLRNQLKPVPAAYKKMDESVNSMLDSYLLTICSIGLLAVDSSLEGSKKGTYSIYGALGFAAALVTNIIGEMKMHQGVEIYNKEVANMYKEKYPSVSPVETTSLITANNTTATSNTNVMTDSSNFYFNMHSKPALNLGLGINNGNTCGFVALQKAFSENLALSVGANYYINNDAYTNEYYIHANNPLYYDEADQITIRGLYTFGSIGFKNDIKDDLRGIYLRSNFLFKKKLDHMDLLAGIGLPIFTSTSDSDYKMTGPMTRGQCYVGFDYKIFNPVGLVLIASTETIYYGLSINDFPFLFYQDSEHRTVFGFGIPVF